MQIDAFKKEQSNAFVSLDFECTLTTSMPLVNSELLTIGQLAQRSGLTTHTIRYYESIGVLEPATRLHSGHRCYRSSDLLWLEFVLKLKRTGMPLLEIQRYAHLRAAGDSTLQERLTLLEQHGDRLAQKMAELFAFSKALTEKQQLYRQWLKESKNSTSRKKKP